MFHASSPYFDIESIINPIAGYQNADNQLIIIEIHEPSCFCPVGIEHGHFYPIFLQQERSENCMEQFVEARKKHYTGNASNEAKQQVLPGSSTGKTSRSRTLLDLQKSFRKKTRHRGRQGY